MTMKIVEKLSDLQTRVWSFLVRDSYKETTDLARRGPKFPGCPKLDAFTVLVGIFFFCCEFKNKIVDALLLDLYIHLRH